MVLPLTSLSKGALAAPLTLLLTGWAGSKVLESIFTPTNIVGMAALTTTYGIYRFREKINATHKYAAIHEEDYTMNPQWDKIMAMFVPPLTTRRTSDLIVAICNFLMEFGFLSPKKSALAMFFYLTLFDKREAEEFRASQPPLAREVDGHSWHTKSKAEMISQLLSIIVQSIAITLGVKSAFFSKKSYGDWVERMVNVILRVGTTTSGILLFFSLILDFIQWIFPKFEAYLERRSLLKQINTDYPGFMDLWISEVQTLMKAENATKITSDAGWAQRVLIASDIGDYIQKDLIKSSVRRQNIIPLHHLLTQLKTLRDRVLLRHMKLSIRPEPFCIWLQGDPGIGKSQAVADIIIEVLKSLQEHFSVEIHGNPIYTIQSGTRFWTGCDKSKLAIWFDDFGINVSSENASQQVEWFQRLKSPAAFAPEQADLADKGEYIQPLLVLVTSNAAQPAATSLNNQAAFRRRVNCSTIVTSTLGDISSVRGTEAKLASMKQLPDGSVDYSAPEMHKHLSFEVNGTTYSYQGYIEYLSSIVTKYHRQQTDLYEAKLKRLSDIQTPTTTPSTLQEVLSEIQSRNANIITGLHGITPSHSKSFTKNIMEAIYDVRDTTTSLTSTFINFIKSQCLSQGVDIEEVIGQSDDIPTTSYKALVASRKTIYGYTTMEPMRELDSIRENQLERVIKVTAAYHSASPSTTSSECSDDEDPALVEDMLSQGLSSVIDAKPGKIQPIQCRHYEVMRDAFEQHVDNNGISIHDMTYRWQPCGFATVGLDVNYYYRQKDSIADEEILPYMCDGPCVFAQGDLWKSRLVSHRSQWPEAQALNCLYKKYYAPLTQTSVNFPKLVEPAINKATTWKMKAQSMLKAFYNSPMFLPTIYGTLLVISEVRRRRGKNKIGTSLRVADYATKMFVHKDDPCKAMDNTYQAYRDYTWQDDRAELEHLREEVKQFKSQLPSGSQTAPEFGPTTGHVTYGKTDSPKKPKSPVKTQARSLVKQLNHASQVSGHSSMPQVSTLFLTNHVFLHIYYVSREPTIFGTRETSKIVVRGLVLCGHNVLILKHYLLSLIGKDISYVEVLTARNEENPVRTSWADVVAIDIVGDEGQSNSELKLLRFPKQAFPAGRCLKKHFIPEAKALGPLPTAATMFSITTENNPAYHSISIEKGSAPFSVRSPNGIISATVSDVFTYRWGAPGDCMSILLMNLERPYVVGVHIAGKSGNSLGISELIVQESLDAWDICTSHAPSVIMTPVQIASQLSTVMEGQMSVPLEVEEVFYPEQVPIDDDMDVIWCGRLQSKFQRSGPNKTSILQSEVHGYIPPATVPAPLSFEDTQRIFSPMTSGVKYHGQPCKGFPPEALSLAAQMFKDHFLTILAPQIVSRAPLSIFEAVRGIRGVDGCSPMVLSTSEGFPYTLARPHGENNKKWLISYDDDLESVQIHDSLDRIMKQKTALRERGIVPATVFEDCLKDARILAEKCSKPGCTRIFSISPTDYVIQSRQYLMHFLAAFQSQRSKAMHSIGLNIYGPEWTNLALRLQRNGQFTKFLCGDYSKFGPTLDAEILSCVRDLIVDWYRIHTDYTECDINVVISLINECIHSVHLVMGHVYQTKCGSPSGSPITAPLNSLANVLYVMTAWCDLWIREGQLTMCTLPMFLSCLELTTYGDDIVIGVEDNIIELFNNEYLQKFFASCGIKYTDINKGTTIRKWCAFPDVEFLKCKFIENSENSNFYLASLDERSIVDCANWVHKCYDMREQTLVALETSLLLAYGRGKEWYDKHKAVIRKAYQSLGQSRPLRIFDWSVLNRMFLFNDREKPVIVESIEELLYNLPMGIDISPTIESSVT